MNKGRARGKVDLGKLKQAGTYLDVDEKVVLELATEFEHQRDPGHTAVSWWAQEEAMDFFNRHGFPETLDRMLTLRAQRILEEQKQKG